MFIGDVEKAAAWSDNAVKGCKRFLDRGWNLSESCDPREAQSPANQALLHKTIKKVADDIDSMKFNTAIAAMMTLVGDFQKNGCTRGDMKTLLVMLSPFAPHIAEELWETLGGQGFCCQQKWPEYDESKTVAQSVTIAVQVGGKMRGTVEVPAGSDNAAIEAAVQAEPRIAKFLEGMDVVKVIHVPGKLVNFIVKPKA